MQLINNSWQWIDTNNVHCPKCGGDLKTAHFCLQSHLNRLTDDLLLGKAEITCDHCGHVCFGCELGVSNDL